MSTGPETIDRNIATPPYRQLADILRRRITSGRIPAGHRIPSQTEIEQEFGVGRNTIKKAVALLKAEDLVETSTGLGLFVKRTDE